MKDGNGKSFDNGGRETSRRKEAEPRLEHSDNLRKAVIEGTTDYVFMKDLQGRYMMANSRALEVLGKSEAEAIGKDDSELFDPETAREIMEIDRQIMASGETRTFEEYTDGPDGTITWLTTKGPFKDEQGNIIGVLGVARDITNRKRAEEELCESQLLAKSQLAELESVYANTPVGLSYVDTDLRYLRINSRLAEMNGKSVSEHIGRTVSEMLSELEDKVSPVYHQVIESGLPILDIEVQGTTAAEPGVEHYWLVSFLPHKDESGSVLGVIAVVEDITERVQMMEELEQHRSSLEQMVLERTAELEVANEKLEKEIVERKEAESKLRDSETLYRTLVETIPHGIEEIGTTGVITFNNRAHTTMMGYKGDELFGMYIWDKLAEESQKEELKQYLKHLVEKQPAPTPYLQKNRTPDGKVIDVQVDWNYKRDETGAVVGFVSVLTDITERKQSEVALSEHAAQLGLAEDIAGLGWWDRRLDSGEAVWSDKTYQILGLEPGEVEPTYDVFFERVHPDDREYVAGAHEAAVTEKKMGEHEYRIVRKDGTERTVHSKGEILCDESGNAVRMIGTIQDVTEHKQAEQAVRQSEEKYRQLVSTMTDAVVLFDVETREFVEVNEAAERLYGYSREEFLKLRQGDITAEPQASEMTIQELMAGKLDRIPLLSHKKKDGTIFPVEISRSTFELAGRRVVCGIIRDITERKKAEEQIARLAKFPEDNLNPVLRISDEGRILYHNKAGKRLLKFWGCVDTGVVPETCLEWVSKALVSGKSFEDEIECDKTIYRLTYAPVVESSYVNMYGQDITERKKAEESIVTEKNKLESILGAIHSGVTIRDLDYNLIYQNYVSKDLYGERIGEKCYRVFRGTDQVCDGCPVELAYKDGKSHTSIRQVQLPTGEITFWEITANPIRDASGEIVSCLEVNTNITERKQSEAELNEYRDKMGRAERLASLGVLSATLTHQLAQPLTIVGLGIQNALADLKDSGCPDSVLVSLNDGLGELSSATSIIERFRNFAKKSSDRIECEMDMHVIAERVVRFLNESARRSEVSLLLEGIDGLPLICSNENDLEQLFFNLINNAIQANDGKQGGHVTISGRAKDDCVELEFSDNCGGISPEDIEKVFEPFFTTKPSDHGTGLGLCIVERIVSEAGGRIRVESKLGEGTSFFVTWPLGCERRPGGRKK